MRVLAGIVEIEGHLFKPSNKFHVLFSPDLHHRLVVTCLDPETNDKELQPHLAPLKGIVTLASPYSSHRMNAGMARRLVVDLAEHDVQVSCSHGYCDVR